MRNTRPVRLPRERPAWPGAALFAAAVIAVACAGGICAGEVSAQPGSAADAITTVPLEYQETGFECLFREVHAECRSVPFPKEPASVHGPLVRGLLKFGANPSNAIPFLWQGGAMKLYLDLNRNQDLTDDPTGVIPARGLFSAGPYFVHQMFTNVPLTFPATSAGAPMLVDLHLAMDIAQHADQPLWTAALRSYWRGKVTRNGHDWEVGLMQNLSDQPGSFRHGHLLLRPWEERNKVFTAFVEVPSDTLAVPWEGKNLMARASDAFPFSPKVFFEGSAWQFDWSTEPRGSAENLALQMTEQPTPLGELRISGSFIQRLVLAGGPYAVVLSHPAATVKIPPGRYYPYRVWLQQDKAQAYFNFGVPQAGMANVVEPISGSQMPVVSTPPPEQGVVVDEQRPALLAVGGPLTNRVSAAHRGRNLLLSYQLVGAGGGQYRMAVGGDRKPPQFAVSKSGKKIHSGQFEFG
jgi:hypothetical protein